MSDLKASSFNIWQDSRYKVYLMDRKSQLLLLKWLCEFLAAANKDLDLPGQELLEVGREVAEDLDAKVSDILVGDNKDSLPVFDYEV